jgi:serine/threonine-protein kinase RsbW
MMNGHFGLDGCVGEVHHLRENAVLSKEWSLHSRIGSEKEAISEISGILSTIEPRCGRVEDIVTVVAEACLNAFEHGNRFSPVFEVRLRMTVQPTKYIFRVLDHGDGISREAEASVGSDQWSQTNPRGWGLKLIRELSDRVEFGWDKEKQFYIEIEFQR